MIYFTAETVLCVLIEEETTKAVKLCDKAL